jgi:hypothetical protein
VKVRKIAVLTEDNNNKFQQYWVSMIKKAMFQRGILKILDKKQSIIRISFSGEFTAYFVKNVGKKEVLEFRYDTA